MVAARLPEPNTRETLIGCARDLLVAEGFGSFSLRRVAALAGVSPTAVYRHFEDKDALLVATVLRGSALFTSYLLRALNETTPRERLRALGRHYFDFAVENPADYEVLFVANHRDLGLDKCDEKTRAETGVSFQLLVDRVAECQRSGDVRDGDERTLALSIWAGVHGIVTLALSGRLGAEPALCREVFLFHQEILLAGVAPPERPRSVHR